MSLPLSPSVSPVRVTRSFDGRAQVAGVEFLHLHRLAALHDVEVGQRLRLLAACSSCRAESALHLAADDFEESNPSGERIGHSLVDVDRKGRLRRRPSA